MGAKILSIFVNIVIYKKFPEKNYMQNIATHEPSLAYQLLSIFVFCLYKVERTKPKVVENSRSGALLALSIYILPKS